jgi:hypothetical protein
VKERELPVKTSSQPAASFPVLENRRLGQPRRGLLPSQLLPGQRQDDHAIDFVVRRLRKLQDYSI